MSTTLEWQKLAQIKLNNKTETNNIDFKRDLTEDQERIKEHINAFGNNPHGGLFVFGINKNFTFFDGPLNQEQIVEKMTSLAQDSQVPPLRIVVHHIELNLKALLAIEILPTSQRPAFIRSRDPWKNGAYKRTGSSTYPMTDLEIRDLLAHSQQYSYDSEPLNDPAVKIEELNLKLLESTFSPFNSAQGLSQGNLQVLLDNKIITLHGQHYLPTLAGWLMFANHPQSVRALKNASIEFQLFQGTTRGEQLKKQEINGTLPEQINLAIHTLQQHLWKIPKIQGVKREEIPSYDQITLREIITNAVVHRDYQQLYQPVKIAMFSDRIEVENPGGLMPGLTIYNLLHKRSWRNKYLATLLSKVGLGEMDGQGIDRIYEATRRLKVPAPIIYSDSRSFKIILSAPKDYDSYSPEEKRLTVLVLLIIEQEIDNESLRNIFSIDQTKASTLLKQLTDEGLIHRTTQSMKYAKYRMTETYHQKIWEE